MKQHMRIGVMASLMAAPVASVVTVSANENIETTTLDQIDTTQQAVNISEVTVASTTPATVATVDPQAIRLQELLDLNEQTFVLDMGVYTARLTSLDNISDDLRNFLTAKITYLQSLKTEQAKAKKLNSDITLLKTTNPDTIAATKAYASDLAKLEDKIEEIQLTFDGAVEEYIKATSATDTYLVQAIGKLTNYTENISAYLVKQVPAYTTLVKFEESIVGAETLITSLITNGTETTPLKVEVGGELVPVEFTKFMEMMSLSADGSTTVTESDRKWFVDQYNANKLYMDTKLSGDSKKIVESHVLANGKKVADVMKTAGNDIAAADKVIALIDAMNTTEFKSESTFSSKVKAINTAYTKLTERGKQLVSNYDKVVGTTTDEDGNTVPSNTGYAAAERVSNEIKALKPATTDAFRDAVLKARESYKALDETIKKFVINEPKLLEHENSIKEAISFEELVGTVETDGSITSAIANTADITKAREKYKGLSAAAKKVVLKTFLDQLVAWEKTAKDSIKVSDTIAKIKIENKKTFSTNVDKAKQLYEALGSVERKQLVSNSDRLTALQPLATQVGQYYTLKLGNTPEYRTAVKALYDALNKTPDYTPDYTIGATGEDVSTLETVYSQLWGLVEPKYNEVAAAMAVETLIETAKTTTAGPTQLTAIQAARAKYDALSANEKKIVNNLKTLTDLEKAVKTPGTVQQQIIDVDPTSTTFESKAKAAVTAFDKLTSSQKSYISDEAKAMVGDYKILLELMTEMKAIKTSNPGYRELVEDIKSRINAVSFATQDTKKKAELGEALDKLKTQLKNIDETIEKSNAVVDAITELGSKFGEQFIKAVAAIEATYGTLSADEKKLVTNYKYFQTLKKDYTAAMKVIDLINNPMFSDKDVENSNFEKTAKAAIAAYDKLTSNQKAYVYNYDSRLKPLLKVYELVVLVNKLNPTSKTYREDIAAARAYYDNLPATDKTVAAPLLAKIEGSEGGMAEVQRVMDLINDAVPGSENFTEKIKEARDAYDRLISLSAAYQKLVLNYKLLQEREKAIGPVTSSIYEIKELELIINRPFNDPTDFVKKYQAAMKAYEKIPFEMRQLVTNREVLLKVIYPVASTLEAIMNIKETSKTFGEDVRRAREMYDMLSASDKALITNYNKLVAFEVVVAGGADVDELIRQIPTHSGTAYTQAIKDARAAYDQLTTSEKRAVSLYAQLQAYEKGVQNVLTAIDLIDALQFSTNLVAAYDKAQKALDKLTADQRKMVSNMQKLTAVAPAIEVYKMIANLKPSAEGYAGSVQAAYAAYNRLSNAEKQYVTNFAQLQDAKNNIDNLNAVIAKIKEIQPGSRNYAKQVQEALALYNSLPASVKKLVTNYDVLKTAETELNAVEKVRSLIAEIDNNTSTFVQKVIAARQAYDKLTATQKRLVSNYFMLEEYERELGTMF